MKEKEGHRFFRNKECRYFPCHECHADEDFNCLFCFCPLYFFDDCGGRPVMRDGIKDCSNCTRPHEPGGYDHVMERLKRYFGEKRRKTE